MKPETVVVHPHENYSILGRRLQVVMLEGGHFLGKSRRRKGEGWLRREKHDCQGIRPRISIKPGLEGELNPVVPTDVCVTERAIKGIQGFES